MRFSQLALCVAILLTSAAPALAQAAPATGSGDDWNTYPPAPAPVPPAKPLAPTEPTPADRGNAWTLPPPNPLQRSGPEAAKPAPAVIEKEEVLTGTRPEHAPGTWGLAVSDPRTTRRSDSEAGTTGLLHLSAGDLGSVGVLRFNAFGEYFIAHEFPVRGAVNTRSAGVFSVSFVPLEFLELFASYAASANTNSLSSPPLLESLGDLTVGGKVAHKFAPGFYAALDLRLQSFSGVGNQDARRYALGIAPRAALTYDFRDVFPKIPIRLHGNVGFLLDGTGRLVSNSLTAAEEYALNINRYNRVAAGAGIEVPLPVVTPFVEYNAEIPVGTGGKLIAPDGTRVRIALAAPEALNGGIKVTALRDLTVTVASEFGLSRHVGLGVPTRPPWNLFVGATWAVDPFLRSETRVRETVRPDPKAPEVKTGKVTGALVDALTQKGLAGAVLTFAGSGVPPVASEVETGRYLTQDIPAGHYRVTASHEGYKEHAEDVEVKLGQTTTLNLALEAQVKVSKFAVTVTAKKKPAAATVQLKGQASKTVTTAEGAAGPVTVETAPGKYTIEVQAVGYLAQAREVQASEGAVMALSFDLVPEPKRRLVIVKDNRIEILQQVHFISGKAAIAADSFPLLQQILDAIVKSNVKRVRIEGHTDNRGAKKVNLALSQDRAQAVADYLSSQGIDASRLEVQGFGDSRPIAPNLTARGRELNRRVEFVILEK